MTLGGLRTKGSLDESYRKGFWNTNNEEFIIVTADPPSACGVSRLLVWTETKQWCDDSHGFINHVEG